MSVLGELGPDDVHVWRIALDQEAATLATLRRLLSADERARADRFYSAKHRDHFTVGRGQLRTILGHYLQRDPAALEFIYRGNGKPALADEALRFNLAHSHGLAVLAVTRGREVGIDVERVRSTVGGPELAERYFSAREVAALASVPEELKQKAFFHGWTRKEAYIKAVGKGLALALDSFDVSLIPGEPAVLLEVRGVEGEAERWTMAEVPVPEEYVAAVLVEGTAWQLRCADWLDEI